MSESIARDMRAQQQYWQQHPNVDPAVARPPAKPLPASSSSHSLQVSSATYGNINAVDSAAGVGAAAAAVNRRSKAANTYANLRYDSAATALSLDALPESRLFSGDVLRVYRQALQRHLGERA